MYANAKTVLGILYIEILVYFIRFMIFLLKIYILKESIIAIRRNN